MAFTTHTDPVLWSKKSGKSHPLASTPPQGTAGKPTYSERQLTILLKFPKERMVFVGRFEVNQDRRMLTHYRLRYCLILLQIVKTGRL